MVERTRADRARFLEPERVVLLLSARPGGPTLLCREGLELLRELHGGLAAMPGVVPGRVRSLASLMDPSPGQTVVEIPDFLDRIPAGPEAWEGFRRRSSQ